MENVEKLKSLVATLELEMAKFEKKNKAAGTRVRGAAQEIKVLAQAIRVSVTEAKNSK